MGACRAQHEPEGPRLRSGVVEIFERFSEPFWRRYRQHLPKGARKALQDILQCRTEAMGARRFQCGHCGHVHFAWHSCHHRLCPRCGAADNAAWIEKLLKQLLPVPYFMVTFTLPAHLREHVYGRPELFHRLFFTAASQALKQILADPKHTGFHQCGFFGLLQTWTQDMLYHPHIHFIVPGIGLDPKGRLHPLRSRRFLVYAQVLADRCRTLMLLALQSGALLPADSIEALWKIDWVTDVQAAGSGHHAVKYLGQYVHRSVISDSRIASVNTDLVTILVKQRECENYRPIRLQPLEFIRRYLLHVLPARFHRIRYYGFLHPRARPTLQLLQTLLDAAIPGSNSLLPMPPGDTSVGCPHCGYPMTLTSHLPRAPPYLRFQAFLLALAA